MRSQVPGRVLVVEDDAVQRLILSKALREVGHEVQEATDASSALVLAHGWQPDIVLLDRYLPDRDGLEVVKALQADATTRRILVVMVTSTADRRFVVDALDAGAHDYLTKPFLPEELLARTHAALRVRRLHEELADLAAHDVLTGLYNRRAVVDSLRAWCAHSSRHEEPLAVVLLDVNAFKAVNDTFGHAVGDDVLKAIAATMQRCLRADDVLGRWGGDEFLAVLPRASAAVAQKLVGRLNDALLSDVLLPGKQVSVRAGITSATGKESLDADELVREAALSLLLVRSNRHAEQAEQAGLA